MEQARNRGRFIPGRSGNPGGRPPGKSLARAISELTSADEIAAYAVGVMRDADAPPDARRWAVAWLADRLEGKAVTSVDQRVLTAHLDARPTSLPAGWDSWPLAEREAWLDALAPVPAALPTAEDDE